MSNSREDETYSTIFTSLKHPIRRKILRMLYESPKSFSEMQETFRIESSHLTYHLENLKELIYKTDNGRYKLSTFGEAAVATMSKVEEVRNTGGFSSLHIKWKSLFVVFTIGLVLLSGVSCIQYVSLNKLSAEFKQLSNDSQQSSAVMQESTVCLVQLTGDVITPWKRILDIDRSPERVVIVDSCYRPYVPCIHVETTLGLWSVNDTLDFAGDQESKFGFHIDKRTGETWVSWGFGELTQEDLDEGIIWHERQMACRKYRLEGYGQWEGENMPYGTITVDDEPFKIYLMIWTEVTEGEWKGGSYIEYEEVWSGRLSFTVTILPLEEG